MPTKLPAIFISYAHKDNEGTHRWLDRLREQLAPLVRQDEIAVCSDQDIQPGDDWHAHIQTHLEAAQAAVLLVSPAFLASAYIANSELPVLLRNAKERGVKIIPVLLSPCLFDLARFKYPDPQNGPEEFTLASLQAIGKPDKTLIEMGEGEQARALLNVAQTIAKLANPPRQETPPAFIETSTAQTVPAMPVPLDFIDDRVKQAARALQQAATEKSLNMRTLIATLDRLFERGTFRYEPSIRLCTTQEWDYRLHAALQTQRLFEVYEPFVTSTAGETLPQYRGLRRKSRAIARAWRRTCLSRRSAWRRCASWSARMSLSTRSHTGRSGLQKTWMTPPASRLTYIWAVRCGS
jgi:hypothetical protein